jgi:hypothetical protein
MPEVRQSTGAGEVTYSWGGPGYSRVWGHITLSTKHVAWRYGKKVRLSFFKGWNEKYRTADYYLSISNVGALHLFIGW